MKIQTNKISKNTRKAIATKFKKQTKQFRIHKYAKLFPSPPFSKMYLLVM